MIGPCSSPPSGPSDDQEPLTSRNGGQASTTLVKSERFEYKILGRLQLPSPTQFGKETRMLCMTRLHDISGEFAMEFPVVDVNLDKISLWLKAPENIQCVLLCSHYAF